MGDLGLRQVFDAVDVDGSGTITADELLLVLQETGESHRSPSDVRAMMSALDVDGDGTVRWLRWLHSLIQCHYPASHCDPLTHCCPATDCCCCGMQF